MAGAWIAALGALVFAFHFRVGRGVLRGPALAPDIRAAWRALHLSPAQGTLVVLAVVFAATAGSLIATGPADTGDIVRLLAAIVLAMGCGAGAALQRFRDLQPEQPRNTDDSTQELARLRLTAEAPFTPPARQNHGHPMAPRFSRLVAGMGLLLAAPVAGLLTSWPGDEATSAAGISSAPVAGAAAAAVTPTAMPATAATPSPAAMVAVALADGARNAAAPLQHALGQRAPGASASATVLAPTAVTPETTAERDATTSRRALDPSLARRECLAQVESAHLFLGIARQSPRPSAYAVNTNPHIKRMLQSRPIGARTLEQIAQGMWEHRDDPDRDRAWWATQFARCERARIAGAPYTVRG